MTDKVCNINHLLEEVLVYFDDLNLSEKIEVRLVTTVPGYKGNVKTNAEELKLILIKLVDLSFKRTDNGFIEFGFHLKENKIAQIYIKDTGSKISREDLESEAFESLQNFVSDCDGKYWTEFDEDTGNTIFFTIPYSI